MARNENKPEMSFAPKKVPYSPFVKAKDELKPFTEGIMLGEKEMNDKREPFCRACYYKEFKQRQAIYDFQRQTDQHADPPSVPNWQDYFGKDKFDFTGSNTRRNRKEGTEDTEQNYKCKKDAKHGVTIMETRPYHPDLPRISSE